MLWARVIRGISSIESSEAPVCARGVMAEGAPRGSAKPMTVCPWRSSAGSPGADLTWSRISLSKTDGAGGDGGPLRPVRLIRKTRRLAGAGLDDNLETGLGQRGDGRGNDGDPGFAGPRLTRNPDFHAQSVAHAG